MARIHPTTPLHGPLTAGDYRERDVLRILGDGLPQNFDVFHNLPWSSMSHGNQSFGELDLVVISPIGHILLIEVKAGAIEESTHALIKTYGGINKDKNIGHQIRRQHSTFMDRINNGELPKVHVGTLLVLPDHAIKSSVSAYPRERIVDAPQLDTLCQHILGTFPEISTSLNAREQVIDFFSNRFHVVPDVSSNIHQVIQASTQLASGLAAWVPKISQTNNIYVIEATAGSGKTQLALTLLKEAAKSGQKASYVCFNRPLADHLAKLTPTSVEVTNFHQLCREYTERITEKINFSDPGVFNQMTQAYVEASESFAQTLDLLIIDESQDFEPTWAEAVIHKLKDTGRLYVMGDPAQLLYEREAFDLKEAVHMSCMDNFRSPRKIVQAINTLRLTKEPIVARSHYLGETPNFYTWAPGQVSALSALNQCLKKLWEDGYKPENVVVLSFHGVKNSKVLTQNELGGYKTKRFSSYDNAGNALWTDGALLIDSVYRFKGQSMPVVVLCEVDFEVFDEKEKRKLFVGLTRAQIRADIVLSEASASTIL